MERTSSDFSKEKFLLGRYDGNHKNDAGGGVVADVSQHESVLSEEEEDLHFQ